MGTVSHGCCTAGRMIEDGIWPPRERTAGPLTLQRSSSIGSKLSRNAASDAAKSASACTANVLTIRPSSVRSSNIMASAARLAFGVSASRGSICAMCQRNSFSVTRAARARIERLCGCNHPSRILETFSAASAQRMRIRGPAWDSPPTVSAKRSGLANTRRTTWLALLIDRRSPPASCRARSLMADPFRFLVGAFAPRRNSIAS